MIKKRNKLFSKPIPRKKLFSTNEAVILNELICQDCGYLIETAANTTDIVCPKCGGNRFNLIGKEEVVEKEFSKRVSLFGNERAFSENPEGDFENNLKLFSGVEMTDNEVIKMFSLNSEKLIEKGYARVIDEERVRINNEALLQHKLFSKLTITITKQLELDPIESRENTINDLISNGSISPKGIMIIKKAHSIPSEVNFSETDEWIKDSGIANDLSLEFGGTEMELSEFKNILKDDYSDAPEDIIESLTSKGVIAVYGDKVTIFK